jgi:transposase InsO family protein
VIALRSNVRWCSDHFELACRNGEIIRVLFAIDACDREIIAWSAATAGISGEMVRDLMVACVGRRFGISKAPITARVTSPRTPSTPPPPWVSTYASLQFVRRNRTVSRKPS